MSSFDELVTIITKNLINNGKIHGIYHYELLSNALNEKIWPWRYLHQTKSNIWKIITDEPVIVQTWSRAHFIRCRILFVVEHDDINIVTVSVARRRWTAPLKPRRPRFKHFTTFFALLTHVSPKGDYFTPKGHFFARQGHYFANWCEKRPFSLSVNGAQTRVLHACVKKKKLKNASPESWITKKMSTGPSLFYYCDQIERWILLLLLKSLLIVSNLFRLLRSNLLPPRYTYANEFSNHQNTWQSPPSE